MINEEEKVLNEILGRKIEQARLDKNMRLKDVAIPMGVTLQQIRKYELGLNRITAFRLLQLAAVFEKDLLWFYDDWGLDD